MSHKKFHGRRQLHDWLRYPLKKMQQKRGFAEGRLLTDWNQIVGVALAAHCVPQKLSFPKGQNGATLHVLCEAGWATELQYQEQLVCEKIASFFGYRAIDRIRIHQGMLPAKENPTTIRTRSETVSSNTATEETESEGDELEEALHRLELSRRHKAGVEKPAKRDDINA